MKTYHLLFAPEGDLPSFGGASAPAVSTSATPSVPSPSKADPWSGTPAPTWIKEAGLERTHNTAVAPAPKPTSGPGATTANPSAAPATSPDSPAETTQPPAVASTPAAPAALTSDAIATAIREGLAPLTQRGQPAAPAEDLAKKLNIFTADAGVYEQLLGVKPDSPDRVVALNNLLQGVAKQAVSIANYVMEQRLSKMEGNMKPAMDYASTQEGQRQQAEFAAEHPDLADPRFLAIAKKELEMVMAQGKKFPDIKSARLYVAEQTRKTLQGLGITPVPSQGNPNPSTPTVNSATSPAPTRKMATTSLGGRGGGSTATGKPANNIEAVWGKR